MSAVPAPTIGRPGDPAAVRSVTLDDVVVTYVVDGVVTTRPQTFFPGTPREAWEDLCNPAGDLLMRVGGLLVEIGGRRVLIDAGAGLTASSFAFGRADSGAMLDVLAMLGVRPYDVDVLAFTHLHFDHVGWAFTHGGRTFPNARYALAAAEWAAYADGVDDGVATERQSIARLRSGRHDFDQFDDGDEIVPGVRALVTMGHTPGHTAYEITSQTGSRLIAFGDAFHSRFQVARPDSMSIVDPDGPGVLAARRRLLAQLSEPHTVAFGGHFGDQPFGRVVVDAIGQASWQPIPSVVLALASAAAHEPGGTQAGGHDNQQLHRRFQMRLGLRLPQRLGVDLQHDLVNAARTAEAAGYESLWTYERLLFPETPAEPYAPPSVTWPEPQRQAADPLAVLTAAAVVTERVRLGTAVLVAALHTPVQLAKALASVDQISGGRMIAGMGTGWSTDELQATGATRADRGRFLDQTLDVFDAVWRPDPVIFRGRRVVIDNASVLPKPVSKIPVLLAGGGSNLGRSTSSKALQRIAKRADGWLPVLAAPGPAGAAELRASWDRIREMASGYGRDTSRMEMVVVGNVTFTDRPAEADRSAFVGTLDQILDDVRTAADAGAAELIIDLNLQDWFTSTSQMLETAVELRERAAAS